MLAEPKEPSPSPPTGLSSIWAKVGIAFAVIALALGLGLGLGLKSANSSGSGSAGFVFVSLSVSLKMIPTSKATSQRRNGGESRRVLLPTQSEDTSIEMYFGEIKICNFVCDSGCNQSHHCISVRTNPPGFANVDGNSTFAMATQDTNYVDITNPAKTLAFLSKAFTISNADIGSYTVGSMVVDKWVRVKGAIRVFDSPAPQVLGSSMMYTKTGVLDQTSDPFAVYKGVLTANGPAQVSVFRQQYTSETFFFSKPFIISSSDFPPVPSNLQNGSNISNISTNGFTTNVVYATNITLMLAYESDNLLRGAEISSNNYAFSLAPFSIAPIIYRTSENVWKEIYFANMSYCGDGSAYNTNCSTPFLWTGRISAYFIAPKSSPNGGDVGDKVLAALQTSTLCTDLSSGVQSTIFSFGCAVLTKIGSSWSCDLYFDTPTTLNMKQTPLRDFSLLANEGDTANFTYVWRRGTVDSPSSYPYVLADRFVVSPSA